MLTEMSCNCDICKSMCHLSRPCWGFPEEIQKIIEAGFGNKLMKDYWTGANYDIYVLTSAIEGNEMQLAPWFPCGKCSMFDDLLDGCILHDKGLKPIEGRVACHDRHVDIFRKEFDELKKQIVDAWDTDKGREIIRQWEVDNE